MYVHLIKLKNKKEEFYKLRYSRYDTLLERYFKPYKLEHILTIRDIPEMYADEINEKIVEFRKELAYTPTHIVSGRCFRLNPFADSNELIHAFIAKEKLRLKKSAEENIGASQQGIERTQEFIQSFKRHLRRFNAKLNWRNVLEDLQNLVEEFGLVAKDPNHIEQWAKDLASQNIEDYPKREAFISKEIENAKQHLKIFRNLKVSYTDGYNNHLKTLDYLEKIIANLNQVKFQPLLDEPNIEVVTRFEFSL